MADNTEEEPIDSPPNNQSEKRSDEIIPTKDTDTINTNQEPENMEVHKHPHHVTHKKKWGEFFLEFLMLFLAVFLGFLAENVREHRVEKEREEQFMNSLVLDLKKDIIQCDTLHLMNNLQQHFCDSLLVILSGKDIVTNSYPAYSLWNSISGFTDFVPNDGTIQQLKNSGALRLIRKSDIVAKLMDYTKALELIRIHQNVMNSYLFQPTNKADLFDIVRFVNENERANVPLLSSDKNLIGRAYLYTDDWKHLLIALNYYFESAKSSAKDLLELINKEYNIK